MVFRLSFALLGVILLSSGCTDRLKTKEKVQEAVLERLQAHSGLDLNQLDVTTSDVKFEKDKATALVAFHPKVDPAINSGMSIRYSLEERDGKWVVTGVNNAHASTLGIHPSFTPGLQDGAVREELPPGHPSIPQKQ